MITGLEGVWRLNYIAHVHEIPVRAAAEGADKTALSAGETAQLRVTRRATADTSRIAEDILED